LFLVATGGACGGGNDTLPDGPPTFDGEPLPPDAIPLGPVTVTTRTRCCAGESGALVEGIDVVLIDADGTARAPVATDADGVARFEDVARGAAVTAIYPAGKSNNTELVTVLGVAPNDEIELGEQFFSERAGQAGEGSISWPAYKGAVNFNIVDPCGPRFAGDVTSIVVQMYEWCQVDVADIRVLALDVNYQVLASGRIDDAAYVPGAALALAEWTPAIAVTATATGVPASAQAEVFLWLRSTFDGNSAWYSTTYVDHAAGTAEAVLPLPADGERIAASIDFRHARGTFGRQEHSVVVGGTATAAGLAVRELPWVGDTTVDLAARTASWTQDGGGAYDGAVVDASYFRPDVDGGEGGISYGWKVLIPAGVTSWAWDEVPKALADLLPAPDDDVDFDLQIVDLSQADGYDGLRQIPEWISTCPSCAAETGELTAPADVSYSYDGGEGFVAGARRPRR
jgi:hypothetical protein